MAGGAEDDRIWMANTPNPITNHGMQRERTMRGDDHGLTPATDNPRGTLVCLL